MPWKPAWRWRYRPQLLVGARRARARRERQALARKGQQLAPVEIAGRTIAASFWGMAWCENLESYSDYRSRLRHGRSYVRNGSVVDLRIEQGEVTARVSGSTLYSVLIRIKPLARPRWQRLKRRCGATIGSLMELVQGTLSTEVMSIVTNRETGLFPRPEEIEMSCSCPDWASMCKHVAATLYGIGSRLDQSPELLFRLRQVDHMELIAQAGRSRRKPGGTKTIAARDLAEVFGIELARRGRRRRTPPRAGSAPVVQDGAQTGPETVTHASGRGVARGGGGAAAQRPKGTPGERGRRGTGKPVVVSSSGVKMAAPVSPKNGNGKIANGKNANGRSGNVRSSRTEKDGAEKDARIISGRQRRTA